MKKTLQIIIALAFSVSSVFSQDCYISQLKTQADVNNFRTAYSGCKVISGDLNIISTTITNLDSLMDITKVAGSVLINKNKNLTSIAGLSGLVEVEGEINIEDNDKLPTLHGLENFSRPGGNVRVVYNDTLTSISALSGLKVIPGFLSVGANPYLTNLSGLENLTKIKGAVSIALNTRLVNLKGIRNLGSVGDFFYIGNNNTLKDLGGLEKLTKVGYWLEITGNESMTSINGINQLEFASIIFINNNTRLSDCSIKVICNAIKEKNISISAYNNAVGCSSEKEIAASAGCNPPNNGICTVEDMKTQSEVDNFRSVHPGCKVIDGDLNIITTTITNLDGLADISKVLGSVRINYNLQLASIAGLSSLEQVDGEINIEDNDNLLSLNGLENFTSPMGNVRVVNNEKLTSISALRQLTKIPGFLSIGENPSLPSLNGLENLIRIEGAVSIAGNNSLLDLQGINNLTYIGGFFYLGKNYSLKNLSGLEQLASVGERLEITTNSSMTSLAGLSKLETVGGIIASYNPVLSACAIKSICNALNTGNVSIYSNATGCNSVEEVSYFCSSATAPIQINAGGNDFNASGAKQFSADKYYAGIDRVSAVATGDILNTTDDELYRSARCSPFFSYNIPMPNGKVNVILHFAETWFGAPGKGPAGAGKRQFHVNIEGSRKLANFDIYAAAGGAMRAIQKSIPVTITDGMLNIDFMTGAADLPRICAIEVMVTGLTLKPAADAYVRDGSYNMTNFGSDAMLDVKYSANNPLSNRSSYLKFQLPVVTVISTAKLRIYGHNHENTKGISVHAFGVDDDSWTEYDIVKSNAPAASTASLGYAIVNDVYKYYEVDVSSYVIAQQQSGNPQVSLLLADPNNRNTRVIFNSMQNGAFPPQLIIQTPPVVNSNTRLNQQEITAESESQPVEESTVYPNPARDKFTVSLSMQHAGPIALELISESGKSYAIATPENSRPGEKTEVDISGLSLNAGIHLLKIKSDAATEVVKVLVAE